jgi:hypothetical protein
VSKTKAKKTTVRGYGWQHQKERARWAKRVEKGDVICARCRRPILPGQKWDLGHLDGTERTVYSGPEHARCNRATSTHRAQRQQRPNCDPGYASREGKRLRWSRVWSWPIPDDVYVPPEAIEEYLAEEKRGVRVSS